MEEYIGLDVSMKETAVAISRDGQRVWRRKCVTDPGTISALIRKRAPAAKRVAFETGPLAVWLFHALNTIGIPVICIDARHAKAALDMARNKTDANDADGLAHLAEVGFYRAVRVKGFESRLTRTLVGARRQLTRMTTQLSNQIRGVMKTFGLIVPACKVSKFNQNVRNLPADRADLAAIVLPLLEAWQSLRERVARLGSKVTTTARQRQDCRLLMSIPSVGATTATSFVAAIEDPDNFRKSRSVRAWVGLTTRRYHSGEVDYDGHISRRGDKQLRWLLYEAASTILTRVSAASSFAHLGSRAARKGRLQTRRCRRGAEARRDHACDAEIRGSLRSKERLRNLTPNR